MYLYGASGHAKVIIDILNSRGVSVKGLFDDNSSIKQLCGLPVSNQIKENIDLIISIGNNRTRKMIAEKVLNVNYVSATHSSAIISPYSTIDQGSVLMQGSIVQSNSKIGKHCIVNTGASVDHDCNISDYVHISPHATLCGDVSVGEGAWIGAGATIIPGIKIGKWSIIGAGAVVVKDVEDNSVVGGIPANVLKQNKEL